MKNLFAVLTLVVVGSFTMGCPAKTEPQAPATTAPATSEAPAQSEAPATETPAATPEAGSTK